jgi:hypothetical protein
MWIVIKGVLSVASLVLSGIGITDLLDRFVKPKVPAQYYPEPVSPGFKLPKILWLVLAFFIAKHILKIISRKTKISFLK